MTWLVVAVIVWLLLALLVAAVIGRAVHEAEVGEGLDANHDATGRPARMPAVDERPPPPPASSPR